MRTIESKVPVFSLLKQVALQQQKNCSDPQACHINYPPSPVASSQAWSRGGEVCTYGAAGDRPYQYAAKAKTAETFSRRQEDNQAQAGVHSAADRSHDAERRGGTEEVIAEFEKQNPLDEAYMIIALHGKDCSWVDVAIAMEAFHDAYGCSDDGSLDEAVCECIEKQGGTWSKTSAKVKFRTTPVC